MFGAPKTPFGSGGFGSTSSAFGTQQATPFGASSGGLFGSKTPAAGTFGTPSFGSTTPASGNLFGGTSTGTSLFGNKTTQATTGFTGFGTSTGTSGGLFGSGSSSLFQTPQTSGFAFGGAKASGFGGFGSTGTSNTFSSNLPAFSTASSSTSGGIFGSGTSSVFGAQQALSGTTVKFVPVTASEQTQKNGVPLTMKMQNQCITVMEQYRTKSVEELRLEDYAANRKGSTSSGFGSGGLFGATTSNTGSSLFGGTAASKPSAFGGFGTPTSTGGLFGGQTSSSSLFNVKTTPSLFGSTTIPAASGFGGFGTNTSSGLFGNTSSAGTSLFGASTTTPSTGLFGNTSAFGTTPASTGGLFGTTSAFGQPASQSNGLFGSTAKPSFGFGTSTGTGFGTNTFGSTASSGGLFGSTAAKPAFSFGGGSMTGFGTATSGFGGFGTTPASTGGLFSGGTTGSLFSNKPTGFGSIAGTTSLFGNTGLGATSGFGGLGATQGTGLGGSSLGGLSNVDQGTLAALRQQQLIHQQLKAIANTPFGDSPLFRNLTDSAKNKTSQGSTVLQPKDPLSSSQYKVLSRPATRVKPRPIASPSMGKSRLFEGLEEESDFSPHSLIPRRSVKKLVIRSKSHQENESHIEDGYLKLRSINDEDDDLVAPSPDVIKSKTTADESEFSINSNKSVQSFDNTVLEFKKNEETTPVAKKVAPYVLTPLNADDEKQLPACKISLQSAEYYTKPSIFELDQQVTDEQCLVRDFTVGREGYGEVKFTGITNVYGLNLDEIVFFRRREVEVYPDGYANKPEVGQELNKPAEITLLKVWPNDKSSHTPVKTPDRLKASGFIDRIEEKTMAMDAVFIDYRPNEGAWVFKVNHFTRYGIQQQFISDDADLQRQKRQVLQDLNNKDSLAEKIAAKLTDSDINFDQAEVIHPSKEEQSLLLKEKLEALQEAEDEEDVISDGDDDSQMVDADDLESPSEYKETYEMEEEESLMPLSHQLGRVAHVQPFNLQGMKTSILYDDDEIPTPRTMNKNKQFFSNKSIFSNLYVEPKNVTSPFQKLDRSVANKPSLQDTLNESVFHNITLDNSIERSSKLVKKTHLFKNGLFNQKPLVMDEKNTSVSSPQIEQIVDKEIFIKCRTFEMVPYEQSLLCGKTAFLADAGLSHGKEFNVRWSNGMSFAHTGNKLGLITEETKHYNPNIFTSNFLNPVSSFGLLNMKVNIECLDVDATKIHKQFIEECLEISLKHTEYVTGVNTTLEVLKLQAGKTALTDYTAKAKAFKQGLVDTDSQDLKLHAQVWDLVSALWGKQELDDLSSLYEVHHGRMASLSKWLTNAVDDDVKAEVEKYRNMDDGHLSVIFSLLSGNQIRAACQVARDNKEIRLAFLLAQLAGDHHLKQYLRNQLSQWEERNIDVYMNAKRLKIYVLLSGMMVWKSSNNEINLCEGVDWKRNLALHLWYYCSTTATIFDAFTEYQNAFKGIDSYDSYAVYPSPEYDTYTGKEKKTKDICYHLLALYCKRLHALEKVLTPKTHIKNPLDYHLSWHLHQVLEYLGYNHLNEDRYEVLQYNYAAQLESVGLWHWAVFVLMHLRDDERREFCVKTLLSRYCRVNKDDGLELTQEENMIVDKFHVSVKWLHEAKALHAKYVGLPYEEAVHLIRADHWDKAHVVIVSQLAADAIIEEDFETLRNLLQDICLPERCCTVKNWRIGGQVFLNYILLNEKLEDIRLNKSNMSSYHLEDMEADIASLINRISIMKVESSRERLCQSEMAKNCSNMLKIIFSQMGTDDGMDEENPKWSSVKVAPYVVDLPLPPDYYLKELRELLSNYVNEIENSITENDT